MISTTMLVIPVLGGVEKRWVAGTLAQVMAGIFDEDFEHVAVLFNRHRRDMFVGATSAINGRHIRNIRATNIYRANALSQEPDLDPESLPAISGPAVLFPDCVVWR